MKRKKKPTITNMRTICFRINRRCNLSCPFCQAPSESINEMTISQIDVILNLLRPMGLRSVKITGGEPLLHDDIVSIIQTCTDLDIATTVCTNAILVNQKLVDLFLKYRCQLKVSLHGLGNRHNQLVGRSVADKVMKSIELLTRCKVKTSIHSIVHSYDMSSLKALLDWSCCIGISKVTLIPMVLRGKGKEWICNKKDYLPSGRQIRKMANKLRSIFGNYIGIRVLDLDKKPYYVIEPDGSFILEYPMERHDIFISNLITDGLYNKIVLAIKNQEISQNYLNILPKSLA